MNEIHINDINIESNTLITKIDSYKTQDGIDFCMHYISDFHSSKIIRDVIDYLCREYNITPPWSARMTLIVDELNNNAIEYGSAAGECNTIHITIKNNSSDKVKVRISVSDSGNGARPKTAAQMLAIKEDKLKNGFDNYKSIRGRGLFLIIYKLVDLLTFEDSPSGGLKVIIEKNIEIK